jgi:hypothetical protein
MSKTILIPAQPTKARQFFSRKLQAAMRKRGLCLYTQRWRAWVEGRESHYFDFTRDKDRARFVQWAVALLGGPLQ